jgi:hypothetical protein
MLYSQSPPLAEDEAAEENPPRGFARDQEARPEPQFGRRPLNASIDSLAPPRRPSIGRRMFRAVTRFVIVVGIGVGGTLGWQAYGDMAKEMLATHAPEQAWLLSYLPGTRPPAAVSAAANPALQLAPLASNLEVVRRNVEALAARQEQLAQNIAAMRTVDEDIRMKLALAAQPPAATQPAAAIPQPKPAPKPLPPPGAPSSSAPRPSPAPGPVSLVPAR